jgi:hypothetical protein
VDLKMVVWDMVQMQLNPTQGQSHKYASLGIDNLNLSSQVNSLVN